MHGILDQFAQGLHVFRSASDVAKSVSWGLITWGLFSLSNAVALSAFGYPYPWYAPFVVAAIVSVVVSLPVAPVFIGQFHFAFVVGLDLINRIDDSVAGGRNLRHGRRSLAALEMTGRGTSVLSWGWCQAVAPIRTHAGSAFPRGTVGTRDGRRSLATLEMTGRGHRF